jgi:hypothetical protein
MERVVSGYRHHRCPSCRCRLEPRRPRLVATHCKYGHERTPETLIIYKQRGGKGLLRVCRICKDRRNKSIA